MVDQNEPPPPRQPRSYQSELANRACNENIIVHLPTGTGKTLIAIHLLRRKLPETLGKYPEVARRSFFLAPNKLLVRQQFKQIKKEVPASVICLTGDENVDDYKEEKWMKIFEENQIIVMTPQVLYDILTKGYIKIHNINVLVFDEAHRMIKKKNKESKYSYRQIMNLYQLENGHRPRILGLTASLINSYVPDTQFLETITEFEQITDSIICTAETGHFYNKPRIFINLFQSEKENFHRINFPFKHGLNVSKEILENPIVKMFGKFSQILNHGPWFVVEYCNMCLVSIETSKSKLKAKEIRIFEVTKQTIYKAYLCGQQSFNREDSLPLAQLVSNKLETLLRSLKSFKELLSEMNCIIFVDQRIEGNLLYRWLDFLSKHDPQFDWIKAGFVYGHNTSSIGHPRLDKPTADLHSRFENKTLNILVATSVCEEGIDVPICNVVIRYDFPKEYRGFCQSKGRARDRESFFMLMVDPTEQRPQELLGNWQKFEAALERHHMAGPSTQMDPREDLFTSQRCIRSTVAVLYENKTLLVLNKYISRLPKDFYVEIAAKFFILRKCNKTDKVELCEDYRGRYGDDVLVDCLFATVFMFPLNSSFPGQLVKGRFRPSKIGSKYDCALNVCRFLYEKGELDERFDTVKAESVIDEHIGSLNLESYKSPTVNVDGEVRSNFITVHNYPVNNYARFFQPTAASEEYFMHELYFEPIASSEDLRRLKMIHFEKSKFPVMGLLFQNPLPLDTIESFVFYKTVPIRFRLKINRAQFYFGSNPKSQELLQLIRFYHDHVWRFVIDPQKGRKLEIASPESQFYIVPIEQKKDNTIINFDLIKKLKQFCTDYQANQVAPFGVSEAEITNDTEPDYEQLYLPPHTQSFVHFYRKDMSELKPTEEFAERTGNKITFEKYYQSKYGIHLKNVDSRLMHMGVARKFFHNFSVYTNCPKKEKMSEGMHNLYPLELLMKYPLDGFMFNWLLSIPCVLYRVEQICSAHDLLVKMSGECSWIKLKFAPDFEAESILKKPLNSEPETVESELTKDEIEMMSVENLNSDAKNKLSNLDKEYEDCLNREMSHCGIIEPIVDNPEPIDSVMDEFLEAIANCQYSAEVLREKTLESHIEYGEATMFRCVADVEPDIHLDTFDQIKCPHPMQILQAISLKKINDLWNLEQMETIGDAFIKMTTALYLYFEYPKYDEGKLAPLKGAMVSNKNLFSLAMEKDFYRWIFGERFDFKQTWFPPAYQSERNESRQQLLRMKDIADCVEALIGCFLIYGAGGAGLRFLDWLGLKAFDPLNTPTIDLQPVYQTNIASNVISYNNFEGDVVGEDTEEVPNEIILSVLTFPNMKTLIQEEYDIYKMDEVERTLGYTFNDKYFLVQALTHPSYCSSEKLDFVPSYQRLEFIGDAILDYVITRIIYLKNKWLNPGQITQLRSALVNNVFYACIAVKIGLHKHLRYSNHQLLVGIDRFVKKIKDNYYRKFGKMLQHSIEESEASTSEEVDVPKALGDIFESLVGAIFLDCNYSLDVLCKKIFPFIKIEFEYFAKNPPSMPIAALERQFPQQCNYGDYDEGTSEICLKIKDKQFVGKGSNKRQAKISAAKHALNYFRELDSVPDPDSGSSSDSVSLLAPEDDEQIEC